MNKTFSHRFSQISPDIFWTLRFLVSPPPTEIKTQKETTIAKSIYFGGQHNFHGSRYSNRSLDRSHLCWGHPHFGGQGS